MAGIFYLEDLDGSLRKASELLRSGSVFIYPTDTVYGIGCSASDTAAVERIFALKKRPEGMPFSVFFPDTDTLFSRIDMQPAARRIAGHFLPGPLTLILPVPVGSVSWSPRLFSTGNYAGIRVPDHPFCRGLGRYFKDAVVTSSVNISGHPVLHDPQDMMRIFGEEVEAVFIDRGMEKRSGLSSTVIRIGREGMPELLREGVIAFSEIAAFAAQDHL